MAGLGQGHETASETAYQTDGLRDTDVLASPTLTNFNQRALLNGVIPLTLNAYNVTARNNTASGNCACSRVSGNHQQILVQAGTVMVDGVIHSIASRTLTLTTTTLYPYNNTTAPVISGDQEMIMLVYFDPGITQVSGKIGFIYGTAVDTSTGAYPTSPSGHLDTQTIVLASARLHYNSGVKIASLEDKRVFARPGPLTLSSVINSSNAHTSDLNNLGDSTGVGSMPITDLGFLFARDPYGLAGTPDGAGQTHLFFQSDQLVTHNLPTGSGGAYQITPIHRTSLKHLAWTPGSQKVVTFGTDILFKPLTSQDTSSLYLLDILAYDDNASGSKKYLGHLVQTEDYTVSSSAITIPANSQYSTASHIEIRYIHAGHT